MNEFILSGFRDELLKLAKIGVDPPKPVTPVPIPKPKVTARPKAHAKLAALKDIVTIAKTNPSALKDILAAAGKGKGADAAKGLLYGSAGYGALTGLGRRDPKTKKREPLSGAARKAAKAVLLAGLPAAAAYRLPAMSRAAAKLVAKTPH